MTHPRTVATEPPANWDEIYAGRLKRNMAGKPQKRASNSTELSKKVRRRRRKYVVKDDLVLDFFRQMSTKGWDGSGATFVYIAKTMNYELPQIWEDTGRKRPALWRDLGPKAKVRFYALAMSRMGECYKADALVGKTLLELADRNADVFLDVVRRKIAGALKSALARKVEFFFAAETIKGRKPHLHGAISVTEKERPRAVVAITKAVGAEGKFKKRAVQTRIMIRPVGVGGYATKSLGRTSLEFSHRNVTATNGLRKPAEALYSIVRARILDEIRRTSAS